MVLHLKAFVFLGHITHLLCLVLMCCQNLLTILHLERHLRRKEKINFRQDLNKATVKISQMFQKLSPHFF